MTATRVSIFIIAKLSLEGEEVSDGKNYGICFKNTDAYFIIKPALFSAPSKSGPLELVEVVTQLRHD